MNFLALERLLCRGFVITADKQNRIENRQDRLRCISIGLAFHQNKILLSDNIFDFIGFQEAQKFFAGLCFEFFLVINNAEGTGEFVLF